MLWVVKERDDEKIQEILTLAKQNKLSIKYATKPILDQLSHHGNHQGVAVECQPLKAGSEEDLKLILEKLSQPAIFLILDGVQDPHNVGACLRSADAFGANAIIAPKDKAVGLNATVAKVASGAAETLPFIQVTNLVRTLDYLKKENVWIYGADGEAKTPLFQANLKTHVGLVLGAEGNGLRRLTREHCDELLYIPMSGSVSSLNVSVAAGIFLFETIRQRTLS